MMNTNKISHLIAIHRCINLTQKRYKSLKKFFDNDFSKAFSASISDWQQAGIEKIVIEKFFINKKKS